MRTNSKVSQLSIEEKTLKLHYLCKSNLQLCAVFSQLNQHAEALSYAKVALAKIQEIIHITFKSCQDHSERHDKLSKTEGLKKRFTSQQQYKLFDSPHYKRYHKMVAKAMPILKFLDEENQGTNKKLKQYLGFEND